MSDSDRPYTYYELKVDTVRAEHYVLFKLIRGAKTYNDIAVGLHLQGLDDKAITRLLNNMWNKKYIEITYDGSPEYQKCLESAVMDKRIKNPSTYCKRKYPGAIGIKITEKGEEKYLYNIIMFRLLQGGSVIDAENEALIVKIQYGLKAKIPDGYEIAKDLDLI